MSGIDTDDASDAADTDGAAPSGLGLYDRLSDIQDDVADGGFRAVTAYDGSTPLLSLVPFGRRIPDAGLPAAPDVALRLSRFAYAHRAEREIRIETPVTAAYAVAHDPRAAALFGALAFDATPRDLAQRVGLPLDAATAVLGLLQSMGVVTPIAEPSSLTDRMRNLVEWSSRIGLPGSRIDPAVFAQMLDLPTDSFRDRMELIWEVHLDGSEQVDVSLLCYHPGRNEQGILKDVSGTEYDIEGGSLHAMGTFHMVKSPVFAIDPGQQLTALGGAVDSEIDLGGNPVLRDLVDVLGFPVSIGVLTARRGGVRLMLPVKSARQLSDAGAVLASAGVDASVVSRLQLIAPLIGGVPEARLAIDAFASGIGHRIGVEIFNPDAWPLMPGVLDALGVPAQASTRLSELTTMPDRVQQVRDSQGVVSDELKMAPLHVKVVFDGEHVSAKAYVSVLSTPHSLPGMTAEDRAIPSTWEFHDLLFHTQVRNGRVRKRLGGTARFQIIPDTSRIGDTDPYPGDIVLPAVDLARVTATDLPFGEVVRRRKSSRDWGSGSMPVRQLSELLARLCESRRMDAFSPGLPDDSVSRVYPSGGGLYETDLVVIVNRVDGLERGAYLYRPASHSLGALHGEPIKLESLLMASGEATAQGAGTPEVLIIFAARFPDLAVKYEGIAYSLMVKHVGVLMEATYLTATAMGLGACAIGTGNADDFAAATGLDYYRHGSTGEIAVSLLP